MTFCLFVHAAVFPKELWPRGYGVNGWVRLEGRKMSKSKGNVWYIRDAVREWGADPVRMAVANAGDGLDDPNLDLEFAATATARLRDWFRVATGDEIAPRAEAAESLLQATLADVREILKVTRIQPKRIALYTAPDWKVRVYEIARALAKEGPIRMNALMERALAEPGMRER